MSDLKMSDEGAKFLSMTHEGVEALELITKQQEQIELLREALEWAEQYTPFSGRVDMNQANKALAATAKG